jgi:XTP/dITP diphosphohydrolase
MRPLVILATRNPGKLREIREILADAPVTIEGTDDLRRIPGIPPVPEIEETGATLEDNALLKARTVYGITGIAAIADDSGLEVDFLGGAPGVISARYAGENVSYDDNNRKLLVELAGARGADRRARFRCVAAYAGPSGEHAVEGRCEGRIAPAGRGRNGFGYDPLFIPDGYDRTFAELPASVKNGISHRSAAFRRMAEYLRTLYPPELG